MQRRLAVTSAGVIAVAAAIWLASRVGPPSATAPAAAPVAGTIITPDQRAASARLVSSDVRLDAIARAQVWREPPPASSSRLPPNPVIETLACRFVLKRLNGTTPKFNCRLDTGEEVRIKYGKGAEIPAEAAATRLLRALGFAADEITLVHRVRCYGCPLEPFTTSKAVQMVRAGAVYQHVIDYDGFHDYEWVALERKYDGWPIETDTQEGWSFAELDRVDSNQGGAPRAHVDALRLAAVFLADWDNKPDNQRLVCATREWPAAARCPEPLLMLQDLGATFGPRKVNLRHWRTSKIWADRATCRITMRHLPYSGATFIDRRITESGRQLLAGRLARLSETDVADLFAGARFDQKRGLFSDVKPVPLWVEAFEARVRLISDGPPCPPA